MGSESSSSAGYRTFFTAKEARDLRCTEKDAVTQSLFARLTIKDPKQYTAVLMPSLWGPEVAQLRARGVPRRNMFAVERTRSTHFLLVASKLCSTHKPMLVQDAVDHIPFDHVDLCYLDFFGQPNGDHIEALRKMFRIHLQRGSRLWTTFGMNRGKTFSCRLNRKLRGVECAGEAYVRAAHALVPGAPPIRKLVNHRYRTSTHWHPASFILTEVQL